MKQAKSCQSSKRDVVSQFISLMVESIRKAYCYCIVLRLRGRTQLPCDGDTLG